jgi:hypothetical protein
VISLPVAAAPLSMSHTPSNRFNQSLSEFSPGNPSKSSARARRAPPPEIGSSHPVW